MFGNGYIASIGASLTDLWEEQSLFSQATFGRDSERGPTGPLKHLKLECDEALANPRDPKEYADLLILVIDSARRAGLGLRQLLGAAADKLEVNKRRKWPAGVSAEDAVLHVKTEPAAAAPADGASGGPESTLPPGQ